MRGIIDFKDWFSVISKAIDFIMEEITLKFKECKLANFALLKNCKNCNLS